MTASQMHVLAFDAHYPVYHKPSWNALLDFTGRNRLAGFVFGGDQLNLEEVSHHTKGKSIYRERGALKRNLDGFDKHILTPVEKLLKSDTERVWLTGNHERFIQDLLDEQPELDGMLDIATHLRLVDRGWQIVPLAGKHEVGHLNVIHGDSVSGGANPAKKAVDSWCASVALGHHHTAQSHTKLSPVHQKKKWTATVLPCLSTTAPTYGRGKDNTWLNGFGIVEVRENRNFNLYTAIITDGQFSFGGKVYGSK